MHHSRQDAILLGIKVAPIRHRQTRRAVWNSYWKAGVYGITIHINEDQDGQVEHCLLLGQVVGNCSIRPRVEDCMTHPRYGTQLGQQEALPMMEEDGTVVKNCPPSSLTESLSQLAPHTELTPLGQIVDRKIRDIGTHPNEEHVVVTHHCIMPTHIHMILEVKASLPLHTVRGKLVRMQLGDIIRSFESGCTSWYYRWLDGETVDEIFASPTRKRSNQAKPQLLGTDGQMHDAPSLWHKDGYNDKILINEEKRNHWINYICMNPYYWKLQMDHPTLFEQVQHLTVAGADYSAYGCMFLLRYDDKRQVMCHRYKTDASGHRIPDSRTGEPIPYIATPEFLQQKESLLQACAEGAVLVSPAISQGEKEIIHEALVQGYPVIKLQKDVLTERSHPINQERDYCARGQMLVLGPWEIPDALSLTDRFGNSKYAQFHNLNAMAEKLCKEAKDMKIDCKVLKATKKYEETH